MSSVNEKFSSIQRRKKKIAHLYHHQLLFTSFGNGYSQKQPADEEQIYGIKPLLADGSSLMVKEKYCWSKKKKNNMLDQTGKCKS